jgi:uncharacterized Zn finger protein (UPF0148 family)
MSCDDKTNAPLFVPKDGNMICATLPWSILKPHRKQFTKADLKDGMVVTIRDGREAVVYMGILNEVEEDIFTKNRLIAETNYCDNLTAIGGRHCYDAMKVSYMGETLWEREEEIAEQKEIKRLRGVIEDAQKALSKLESE